MVSDDIEKLQLFCVRDYCANKYSKITSFAEFDLIYRWTNEEMKIYPKENLDEKKVLTITASADQALEAILCGATNIDSIDINIFAKYYSALKIAMIKKYDHVDFFKKINEIILFNPDERTIKKIIDDISFYLTDDEIRFWHAYANFCSKRIVFGGLTSPVHNEYYSKEKYNELKNRLDDVNISYYDGDIFNINKILKDRKYDYMYLSNVLERVVTCIRNKKKTQKEITKKLSSHLNENGSIYNYFLGFENTNLDEIFGRYINPIEKKYDIKYYYDDDSEYSLNKGIIRLDLK